MRGVNVTNTEGMFESFQDLGIGHYSIPTPRV